MIRLLQFVSIAFLLASFSGGEPKFHSAPAQPGDGVFSLLRRYDLDRNSCNHAQFYKLNSLKNGATLKVGKSYILPILIYKFNGKTIRSSVGIDDWATAKTIETYNEDMLKDGYRKSSFKSDKVLWVPYHLLNCPDEDVPQPLSQPSNGEVNLASKPSGGSRSFPIFGKKYEHVPLISNELRGKVFYIESGHGGPDPGAMCKKGSYMLCEDEYAYDVALRLVRILVAHGATAYMVTRDPDDGIRDEEYLTCDSDEVVWGNDNIYRGHKPRLFQRSDLINSLYDKHKKQGVKEQKLVVIHVDSRGKREQTDLYFYYHPDDTGGKQLALDLHNSVKSNYLKLRKNRDYEGTVTSRDLHMLRETKVISAYVELGNIRNYLDQQRIIVPENRQLLADWLFEGLR